MNNRFKCYKIKPDEHNDNVFVIGNPRFFNNNKTINDKELKNAIKKDGFEQTIKQLWGQFSIICCSSDCIKIAESPTGDLRDVLFYWSQKDTSWYISDSIRYLINSTKETFCINQKSVEDFINFGYVLNENTLVKNVYKAASPNIYILKPNGTYTCRKADYNFELLPYSNNYLQMLVDSISHINNKSAVTLSSGYDSNLILFSLINRYPNEIIYAMSVGGKIGRNETPTVEKICKRYNNVTLYTSVIDNNLFIDFPKIIYLLEGSMFERGCFLQYELSKIARINGVETIIGGEGADQIMRNTFSLEKVFCEDFTSLQNYWHDYPQDVLRNIVVKKSGMIMTGSDIDCVYPYLSPFFYSYYANKSIEKEHHKKEIQNILPVEITAELKKYGGSTNLELLFSNKISYDRIHKLVEKTPYAKIKRKSIKNYTGIDDGFEYNLKIIYVLIFEKIFCSNNNIINSLDEVKDLTYYLEMLENELS